MNLLIRGSDLDKMRLCACGCGSCFAPARKDQIYFDRNHKKRASMRRRRSRIKKARDQGISSKREKYIEDKNVKILKRSFYLAGGKNGNNNK